MMRDEMMEQRQMGRENLLPALAVAQTPFVRVAGEMIMNTEGE